MTNNALAENLGDRAVKAFIGGGGGFPRGMDRAVECHSRNSLDRVGVHQIQRFQNQIVEVVELDFCLISALVLNDTTPDDVAVVERRGSR